MHTWISFVPFVNVCKCRFWNSCFCCAIVQYLGFLASQAVQILPLLQANLSDSSGDWMAEVKDATKVPWTTSGVFWLEQLIRGATDYKTGCIWCDRCWNSTCNLVLIDWLKFFMCSTIAVFEFESCVLLRRVAATLRLGVFVPHHRMWTSNWFSTMLALSSQAGLHVKY